MEHTNEAFPKAEEGFWEENVKQEQTREETDKKCPNCGGVMDFHPVTGGLICPYCGYQEEIPAAGDADEDGRAEELDFSEAEAVENCDWGAAKKMVICKACGAESVYDELELSNECPYCGSNQVMEEKNEKTLAPGGVVLFKLTAREAAGKFSSWIKRKLFCPRAAKDSAKPGAFKGVYLPYWTFDADTDSRYQAQYGIDRIVGRGEKRRKQTMWYQTAGRYRERIDDQAVLASGRYEASLLQKIEPFQTEENKVYRPEYVAGFIAERYSLGLKDAWEKAKDAIAERLKGKIQRKVQQENRADHAMVHQVNTQYSNMTYKYLLVPVWLSTYRYNGKVYHFMVNGQTGKSGGTVPVSPIRVAIALLLVASAFLVTYADWEYCLITLAAALICFIVCKIKRW